MHRTLPPRALYGVYTPPKKRVSFSSLLSFFYQWNSPVSATPRTQCNIKKPKKGANTAALYGLVSLTKLHGALLVTLGQAKGEREGRKSITQKKRGNWYLVTLKKTRVSLQIL